MSASSTCPTCGASVLADAVAGQCPRCLLRMARTADERPNDTGFDSTCRQFGDYILGRQLGAGGMGVVYEARRLADDRIVALKLIREFYVASAAQVRRFTIEAEAAARLDHPHIVRIHEVGEWEGQPFICMDFIAGESLGATIAAGDFTLEPASPNSAGGIPRRQLEIARLMAKVARAVHHAHLRGVLHRDLKPGNILLDGHGEPHLTDFGLAKILPRAEGEGGLPTLTASGDVPGTPSYMAPEQASGGPVSYAADVYGLGAVLYALLTGRPPFLGPTPLEVFKQIVDQAPTRPRALVAAVASDLETICLKCLEKDPRHRYGSAQALADDLANFARGRPIQARSTGPWRRARQWTKRNPVAATLVACLGLGLAVSLALLKVVNDQRRAVELDRDEAFDEGMQKISLIWSEPDTRAVTISARELAILAGRSPLGLTRARYPVSLGVSASDKPASMAQRYARLLGSFQERMEPQLGNTVAFHLRLLKRTQPREEALARREVDFIVLSAVEFLRAQSAAPGAVPVAWANTSRDAVIFARTNSGIERLADLRGRSLVLPDPGSSLTIWAKARLLAAGLRARDLRDCTAIADQPAETGTPVFSVAATLDRVLRGEADAGVTRHTAFERYRHLGLVILDQFPETPNVLAAREDLDPTMVEALRQAIRALEPNGAWPEHRFVAEPLPENGALAVMRLDALGHAAQQAEQFDGTGHVPDREP